MFTWILIIGGVLLVAGLAWSAFGRAPKKWVDHENVRNIKRNDSGKGGYYGGGL